MKNALQALYKVLCIMPAILWGTIYACIILLGGIQNLEPVSLSYPVLFLLAAILLWKNKWYGCLPGILTGVLMLVLSPDARTTGTVFCLFFAVMGLICYTIYRRK